MVESAHKQREQLAQMMAEMKLRQWCVEKALSYIASRGAKPEDAEDVIKLIRAIMKFVSEPFSDVFKDPSA